MNIFTWLYYYCPIWLMAGAVGLAIVLVSLAAKCLRGREGLFKLGLWVVLGVWFLGCLWLAIFSRDAGNVKEISWIPLVKYFEADEYYRYEYSRGYLMNALLFVPMGLVVPFLVDSGKGKKTGIVVGLTCLVALGFSFMIESLQYFLCLGYAEVDDLIFNTLGAGIGCLADVIYGCLREN